MILFTLLAYLIQKYYTPFPEVLQTIPNRIYAYSRKTLKTSENIACSNFHLELLIFPHWPVWLDIFDASLMQC